MEPRLWNQAGTTGTTTPTPAPARTPTPTPTPTSPTTSTIYNYKTATATATTSAATSATDYLLNFLTTFLWPTNYNNHNNFHDYDYLSQAL